ncbi:heme-binding domain-containing protein [Pedobacter sp. JCM 36344]|uniref:heme-binding domain-containing protein n=1 Tax=Pedobacter sp. JCM 36344 TaxID=3374280 RepID=UPI00397AD3AD
MKGIKTILLVLLVILVIIQFIQPGRNKSGQAMPDDISKMVNMPANVQGILQKACYDCHSNNTQYPWYANVQPFNWFLNNHIQSGKAELNFNEFGTYTPRRQQSKLRSIENRLKDGTMPLSSYTLIHRNVILSEAEKSLITNWVQKSKDSLNKKSF